MAAADDTIQGKIGEKVSAKGRREEAGRQEGAHICSIHNSRLNCYCMKCIKSVCSECVAENHMRCDNHVSKIESIKPIVKTTLNDKMKTMTNKMQQIKLWMKKVEDQMGKLRRMESNVRDEIKATCENAIKLIREWENTIQTELSSVMEQEINELTARLKTSEIDLQTFRQYSEFISRSLTDGDEIDMINMYAMCQSGEMLTKTESDADPNFTQDLKEVKLELYFSETEIRKNFKLGKITVEKPGSIDGMTKESDQGLTASLLDIIDTDLRDVTVMEVGGVEVVVAADWFNQCLKSSYMKNKKPCVTAFQLRCQPNCVTRLGSNQVAVSLPLVREIILVKVTPDLTKQSTIPSKREYNGLTSLDETTLAAGCLNPPCVDILDLRGQVEKTITPGRSLIQFPTYLSTTQEGNILVSDRGSKSVVCLTRGGDVVFKYPPTVDRALGSPLGITTTATGDILVAVEGKNKVIQLTGAGEYVKDLLTELDNIDNHHGICVHKNKLYIADYPRKTILVFKLI